MRRKCQINEYRTDLNLCNLHGNINTRINKLNNGKYDAIILAVAGLKRLVLEHYIRMIINSSNMLLAAGQGALGIECRLNDNLIITRLMPLHHWKTAICVNTERIINKNLNANCQLPIGSYAEINNNQIWLHAFINYPDGASIIRGQGCAPLGKSEKLGFQLSKELLLKTYKNKLII